MSDQATDIVLEINVQHEQASRSITAYAHNVVELRKETIAAEKASSDAEKQLKACSITQERCGAIVAQSNKTITTNKLLITQTGVATRALRDESKKNAETQQAHVDSLKSLRDELKKVKDQYDQLSEADRDGAIGTQLMLQINQLNSDIRAGEHGLNEFIKSVGDYEKAMVDGLAQGNAFAGSLLNAAKSGKGFGGVLTMMKSKFQAFSAVVKANPVMAIVSLLLMAFNALKDAVNSNAEASARMNKILEPLKVVMDGLMEVVGFVVDLYVSWVEVLIDTAMYISKLAEKLPFLGKAFGAVNEKIEENIKLQKEKEALERAESATLVKNAKLSSDLANLRAQAEDKLTNTAKERYDFMKKANDLERQNAEDARSIAYEKMEAAKIEFAKSEQTAENYKKLSEAQAEYYKTNEAYIATSKRLNSELAAGQKEILDSEQEKTNNQKREQDKRIQQAQAYNQKLKELDEKRLDALRQFEDSALRIITNEKERQEKEISLSYDRQIADLRRKLLTEKGMLEGYADAINKTINNLEIQKEQDLANLSKESLQKETDRVKTDLENRLQTIKSDSQEASDIRKKILEKELETELRNAEKLGLDKSRIEDKYRLLIEKEDKEHQDAVNAKFLAGQKKEFEDRLSAAKLEGLEKLKLALSLKQEELGSLEQMQGESDEQFVTRKATLDQSIIDQNKAVAAAQIADTISILGAYETLFSSLSSFMGDFAEQSETMAAFSKGMALYEIGLSTSKALASGIASAQAVPFPGNLVAIATTTATILGNITKAKKLLTAEKSPKAPKMATGGLVQGPGSGTSDSVNAHLSNGESVLTARATSMFGPMLSAFNQIGGGVPISTQETSSQVMGEDMLTRAMAKALKNMPQPRVSVEEITAVSGRIDVLENSQVL